MAYRQTIVFVAVLSCCAAWLTVGCGTKETVPRSTTSPASSSADLSSQSDSKRPTDSPESPGETTMVSDDLTETTSSDAPPTPVAPTVADSRSDAYQWGNLRGRFVFDGAAPAQRKLNVNKDVEFCGKHSPLDESLVVSKENGGIANVVVALYTGRGDQPPPTHESYNASSDAKLTLDNTKCRFEPHVIALRTSQTLIIHNSDDVGHNTKIDTFTNPAINQTTPVGGSIEHQFSQAERVPATVSCSIHPWMRAWVVITQHPYAAVTDSNGAFEIQNLPAGEWTFRVWHEKSRAITQVTLDGKKIDWKRGRFTIEIKPSETLDLGEVKLSPELFED